MQACRRASVQACRGRQTDSRAHENGRCLVDVNKLASPATDVESGTREKERKRERCRGDGGGTGSVTEELMVVDGVIGRYDGGIVSRVVYSGLQWFTVVYK